MYNPLDNILHQGHKVAWTMDWIFLYRIIYNPILITWNIHSKYTLHPSIKKRCICTFMLLFFGNIIFFSVWMHVVLVTTAGTGEAKEHSQDA